VPSPTAAPEAEAAVYWAIDHGPVGTPDEGGLWVYLFANRENVGVITLIAPDGAAAGKANVMGSGIFTDQSCVSSIPTNQPALRVVGRVIMTKTAQEQFIANPSGYTADVDQNGLGLTNPRRFELPLADSGCRPLSP
jgi:hypothetical protein